MSRRDDIRKLYKIPSILNRIKLILFFIDVFAAFIAFVEIEIVSITAIYIQIVAAFLYFVCSVVLDGFFWYRAEKARRKNAVENGLEISMSEFETGEYYNNPIKPSVEKYAINLLESNYFSKEIAGKMILPSSITSVLAVLTLLLACCFVDNSKVLLIVAQTVFSSHILVDTIMLILYKWRLDDLFNEGYYLMITAKKRKTSYALLIAYAVEYEAIKAHYKIRINEKLFNQNNEKLSKRWEQILSHKTNHIKND